MLNGLKFVLSPSADCDIVKHNTGFAPYNCDYILKI